jgi:hypothetical protein
VEKTSSSWDVFSYISPEQRVPQDLRRVRCGPRPMKHYSSCNLGSTAGRSWHCDARLPRGKPVQRNARIEDGPGREVSAQRQGQRSQAELQREPSGGEPQRVDRKHRGVLILNQSLGYGRHAGLTAFSTG